MPDNIKMPTDYELSHPQLPPLDTEKPKPKHKARKPKRVQMENLPIASTARFAQLIQCGAPYNGYVKSADNCVRKVSTNINDGILELGENIYTVIPGDNLTKISKRFGVSIEDIAKENGIDDVNHILVGDQLKIPTNDVGHYQACVVEAKKVETGEKKKDEKQSSLLVWLEKLHIFSKTVSDKEYSTYSDGKLGTFTVFETTIRKGHPSFITFDSRADIQNGTKFSTTESVTVKIPFFNAGVGISPQNISANLGVSIAGFVGENISITLTPNIKDWSINVTGTENLNQDNVTNGFSIGIKPAGLATILVIVAVGICIYAITKGGTIPEMSTPRYVEPQPYFTI